MKKAKVRITGQVVQDGQHDGELAGLTVEAKIGAKGEETKLLSIATKSDGSFEFRVDRAVVASGGEQPPKELLVNVMDSDGRLVGQASRELSEGERVPIIIKVPRTPAPTGTIAPISTRSEGMDEDQKTRSVRLRLQDSVSGEPITARDIRAFLTSADGTSLPLAHQWLGEPGALSLRLPQDALRDVDGEEGVRLEILGKRGARLGRVDLGARDLPVSDGDEGLVRAVVDDPTTSPRIEHWARATDLPLSATLRADLDRQGIERLADLRRVDGIEDVRSGEDRAALETLRAHAYLNVLSQDPDEVTWLVAAGFDVPLVVARTSREQFVATLGSEVGAARAAELHGAAVAQSQWLESVAVGLRADAANRYVTRKKDLDETLPEPPCECPDHLHALSPLAYLSDLFRYALDHLVDGTGEAIGVSGLVDTLFQPIDRLSSSAEPSKDVVRQVRLCIEVLRRYLLHELTSSMRAILETREPKYRQMAYETLLLRIGTSFDELRLARGSSAAQREAIAERLGLDSTDRLDALLLDETTLTEPKLQSIFGLIDTDPHRQDPLVEPPPPELEKWRLARLRDLWSQEDWPSEQLPDGRPVIDPDVVGPDDFRRPISRWQPIGVAAGGHAAPDTELPLIVAFGGTVPSLGGVGPFELWEKRRGWVDERLSALYGKFVTLPVAIRPGRRPAVRGLDGMLVSMYKSVEYDGNSVTPWLSSTPVAEFEEILAALHNGSDDEVRAATQRLDRDLAMSGDAFKRLVNLRARHQAASSDPRVEALTDEEWRELKTILVQAQKQRCYELWRAEEAEQHIELSPEVFWFSSREPEEGAWPPVSKAGVPWLDPDEVTLNDLPEPTAGSEAIKTWMARRTKLETLRALQRQTREDKGVDHALLLALGDPGRTDVPELPHDLSTLRLALASNDSAVVDDAKSKIEADLYLSLESFSRLMTILAKADESDPAQRSTAQMWAEFDQILTDAHKRKRLYPVWHSEEQTNIGSYWRALKAKRDPWLAPARARADWHAVLRLRDQPPLVDPDLLGIANLRRLDSGDHDPAYRLWSDRRRRTVTWARELIRSREVAGTPAQGLSAMVRRALGVGIERLESLADLEGQGYSIKPRLGQLRLDRGELIQLLRLQRLLSLGPQVLATEWDDAVSILVQAQKRAEFWPWRREEQEQKLVLGPDHFMVRHNRHPLLPRRRASLGALRDWQDKLQARVDQEAAVITGLKQAAAATEQATLPFLRDALIEAAGDPDTSFTEKADTLAKTLLIGMRSSGCHETTRVGQAIETIQGLVHGLRTGQLGTIHSGMALAADDFDEDWRWMGSYAAWRAAMFVFLYPENLLEPTLRRHTTPWFDDTREALRSGPSPDPSAIKTKARQLTDHMNCLKGLQIRATCTGTRTRVFWRGDEWPFGDVSGTLAFRFFVANSAPGDVSRVFVSARSALANLQTFWSELSELPAPCSVIGAATSPYYDSERFLYVFFRNWETEEIGFTRYDLGHGVNGDKNLLDGKWSTPVYTPATRDSWRDGFYVLSSSYTRPGIMHCRNEPVSHVRENLLNEAGDDWLGWEEFPRWTILQHDGTSSVLDVFPISSARVEYGLLVDYRGEYWVCMRTGQEWVVEVAIRPPDPLHLRRLSTGLRSDEWRYMCSADDQLFFESRSTADIIVFQVDRDSSPEFLRPVIRPFDLVKPDHFYKVVGGSERNRVVVNQHVGRHAGEFVDMYVKKEDSAFVFQEEALLTLAAVPNFDATVVPSSISTSQEKQRRQCYLENMSGRSSLNLRYAQEAWYFYPMLFASALQRGGHYVAALDWLRSVYDYGALPDERKLYPGLEMEEDLDTQLDRNLGEWLDDPLNPHAFAATRANAYSRYTLISLVRCLLAYGDAEFARDTAESLPRARMLFQTAANLLDTPDLAQDPNECERLENLLEAEVATRKLSSLWPRIQKRLALCSDSASLKETVDRVRNAMNEGPSLAERAAKTMAALPTESDKPLPTVGQLATAQPVEARATHLRLLKDDSASAATARVARVVRTKRSSAKSQPDQPPQGFCIPPNPVIEALRLHVKANRVKLQTCRNIAGIRRQLSPYAASTDTTSGMPTIGPGGQLVLPGVGQFLPTQYRYKTLIDRARQLVAHAKQVEAAMLASLEKGDEARYSILTARQNVDLMGATVRLQRLRVSEANTAVELANLQREAAEIRWEHFNVLIAAGLNDWELGSAYGTTTIAGTYTAAAAGLLIAAAFQGPALAAKAAEYGARAAETTLALFREMASYERRQQEWNFQLQVAAHDGKIGEQQVAVAQASVEVVDQEQAIAELQSQNAKDVLEFLDTRFANVELYDWMGTILTQVYAYFLQQATALAKTASDQLAFERQEPSPAFIQTDYWQAPNDTLSLMGGDGDDERHGLTGSARLLRDIEKLDLYAFRTDERRLNLKRMVSLASCFPEEMERFRQTGKIVFPTPMEWFDRDRPGHYLRLVHRIGVSVIALIPPTAGIHATLMSSGLSNVVVGGELFQTVQIHRSPESIALSSPVNDTGIFELDPQAELRRPFEGIGLDTIWELSMPRAANWFDYRSIADILVTIEYTARDSYTYRQQVLERLSPDVTADRAFSFRHHLPDAWYELCNPKRSNTPMVVSFETRADDFPANLDRLRIAEVSLYFSRGTGATFEVPVERLELSEIRSGETVGGGAASLEGIISTRRGNAPSWLAMKGRDPCARWELAFPNTDAVKGLFAAEQIQDVLLVVTYKGQTPAWTA